MSSVETLPGVFRHSPLFSIAFFTLNVCLVAGQTPTYLLQGKTFTFVTDVKEKPEDILWKHEGNKIVEFDGSEQISFGSYEHRVTLDWHSAALTISNLRHEDSGLYELDAFINKKLYRKRYELEVIDKVAKPEISCKIMNTTTEKSGGQATLTCSSASSYPQSLLKFQWSSETNSHDGPKIMISLGDDHDDHIYNCSVSNPLSKDSAVFQAKDCYPDTESNAGMIAAIVVLLFLIIFGGIVLMLWFRHKRENKDEKKSEENFTPDVENMLPLHECPNSPSKQRNGLHDRSQEGPEESMEKTALLPPGSSPESPKKNNLANPLAANGNTDSDVEKQDLDDPEHSRDPNKEFNAVLDNQSEKEEEEGYGNSVLPIPDADNPFEYEETNTSNDHSPEISMDKDKRASIAPEVPPKSELARHYSILKKAGDGIINPEVNEQSSDDHGDSGNADDEVAVVSDNQSPEISLDKDKRAPIAPEVPPKSELARQYSILKKAGDGIINPDVNKQGSDDPEDSGNPDDDVAAVSDNQSPERSMDKDTKGDGIINPEVNDPADSGNPDDEVTAVSDNQSGGSKVPDGDGGGPERSMDKDKRALIAPKVPPKPKVARNYSILKQARDENINPDVNKQGSDDPEDSGNPDDDVAAVSDNQNKEVEEVENHGTTSTSKSNDDKSTEVENP